MLREALTNILRHSSARACVIEVTTENEMLRLRVSNDGVSRTPGTAPGGRPAADGGGGRGLANLTARVRAVGGQLTSGQTGDRFDLVAEIPCRLAEIRWPPPDVGSTDVRPGRARSGVPAGPVRFPAEGEGRDEQAADRPRGEDGRVPARYEGDARAMVHGVGRRGDHRLRGEVSDQGGQPVRLVERE